MFDPAEQLPSFICDDIVTFWAKISWSCSNTLIGFSSQELGTGQAGRSESPLLLLVVFTFYSLIYRAANETSVMFSQSRRLKAPVHLVPHPYTQARICCNSKAECKDYTLGPNWACPGISVSQLEKSFTNEKVTFYKPLYVYTVCEPIGGVV